ncbi:MAG: PEP-CTERM sorting domain-containing protein [Desulfobacterales bacterium]|nr:MAG: PEP-CTERM sorting domain-containing protein [Desulfobacterales bacterium]
MTKKFYIILSLALFGILRVGTAFAAIDGISDLDGNTEITIKPSTTFEVKLFLEFSEAERAAIAGNGITGFTVDIQWDPMVELVGFAKGPGYTFVDVLDNDTAAAPVAPWVGNQLNLQGYNFGLPLDENHLLETFTLHCLAPGDTVLLPFGHFPVSDDLANFGLADATFLENLAQLDYQGITIHQTPIPSTILLLGGGLLGLIGLRRRRS